MRFILPALLLVCACLAQAADVQPPAPAAIAPAKLAALEKLFAAIRMQEKYEAGLVAGFRSMADMGSDQMPAEMKAKMKKGLDRVQALMIEKVGYAQVKTDLLALYDKSFTQAEVDGAVAIFSSPAGQAWFAKEVALVGDAMQVSQAKVKDLMPEIQQIMMEEMSAGQGGANGPYSP